MLLLLLTPRHFIGSLLHLNRALDRLLRNRLFGAADLTVEQASILLELEGTFTFRPPSQSLKTADGFVAFSDLAGALLLSKPAVSRRLAELQKWGLIERRPVSEGRTEGHDQIHGNAQAVRITPSGRKRIAPVLGGLNKLSAELCEGMTMAQRRGYCDSLELFRQRIEHRFERKNG